MDMLSWIPFRNSSFPYSKISSYVWEIKKWVCFSKVCGLSICVEKSCFHFIWYNLRGSKMFLFSCSQRKTLWGEGVLSRGYSEADRFHQKGHEEIQGRDRKKYDCAHTHTYTQRLFGLVLISFVYHTFWFSEDREQKYLTEWCQAVQTSSVGQKQSTHATGFLPDSDCGTSGFKQVNHHHQNTPCSLLHLE